MKFKLLSGGVIGLALAILFVSSFTAPASGYYEPIIEELTFSGEDFTSGEGYDFAVSTAGLMMADDAFTTIYTSPIIEAPLSFNVVIPQWTADMPDGSSMDVQMRSKTANGSWSEWKHSHTHGDWTLESDTFEIGELVIVPLADDRHTHVQFSISMSRYNSLTQPVVQELTLVFIDSTGGPSAEEMLAQQAIIDAAQEGRANDDNYARPTVISREVWCFYDDCDYTNDLEYSPATHMVVHHTVSSNESANWAATVRAIWSFHTYTRGWGDIGYNYMIDMNGVIYEGHMNEDFETLDVKGTHASGANLGSMGVALLGTFTEPTHDIPGIEPPEPMVDSLVELLSWKADQQDIDVFDATATLPDIPWGLPHIMGHRNVYGTTVCPGDQAHNLIPTLVDRVAANIGLTNKYTVVDERSANVTLSAAAWAVGPDECGNNIHSYYTLSTTNSNASNHWAEWNLDVPTEGYYEVEVRVPYCLTNRAETSGANYEITDDIGSYSVVIDQNTEVGNWIRLGSYYFSPDGPNHIYLSDLTTTDDNLGLWVDDLRFKAMPPSITAVSPTNESWQNDLDVNFEWNNSNAAQAVTTTLQISSSPTFTETIVDRSWATDPISYTHTFSEESASLYWRVSAIVSGTGEIVTTDTLTFGIDTTVPTSTVQAFYEYAPGAYRLIWNGSDELSGIQGYDVSYRPISSTNPISTTSWTPWLTGTLETAVNFIAPESEQSYEFLILAIDNAGNRQPEPLDFPSTDQAIAMPHAIMLPIIRR
ncbi:MAG: N-acetylmuramoyl-L-alanine amidase [Chloroflexota bacterium]